MEHIVANLLQDFERGKLTRRHMLQCLAMAGAAASCFAQTTEQSAPSAAAPAPHAGGKGFQAISIDHVSYLVEDYHKTADFYADLLGLKPYNDTGRAVNLLLGDDDTYMVIRNATANTPRVDHVCYKIAKWDTAAVEAELKGRGLTLRPVSDNPQSFMVKDINGYGLQISGEGFLPTAATQPAKPAPDAAKSKGFQAVSIEHVSYLVEDYRKTADFYADLLGLTPYHDTGAAIDLLLADKNSYLKIGNAPANTPSCDHIAFKIAKWDTSAVEDELKRRNLAPQAVSDNPQSFMVKDVNGYGLQISGRGAVPATAPARKK